MHHESTILQAFKFYMKAQFWALAEDSRAWHVPDMDTSDLVLNFITVFSAVKAARGLKHKLFSQQQALVKCILKTIFQDNILHFQTQMPVQNNLSG